MNLKKIICLAAALSVSSHVFAMEIYKGKVVSEKLWSSDGSKAKVAPSKKSRHANRHFDVSNDVFVQAVIAAQTAKVNEYIEIENSNNLSLQNTSDETHTYYVGHNVCSETSEGTAHCVHYHRTFELSPGGYVEDDFRPVLEQAYSKPGTYKIESYSSYGEDGAGDSNYDLAASTITVS